MTNLYNYLEIPSFSEISIVIAAFYRLYNIYTPSNIDDMPFPIQQQIKCRLKEIKTAYNILSDPHMKIKYDEYLKEIFDNIHDEQSKALELQKLIERKDTINNDITKRQDILSSDKKLQDLDIRIAKIKAVLGSMQWRKIDMFSKLTQSNRVFEKLSKNDSEYQSAKKDLKKSNDIYESLLSEIYEVERQINKLEQEKKALREEIFSNDVWLSFLRKTLEEIESEINNLKKSNVRRYYDRNKQQKS